MLAFPQHTLPTAALPHPQDYLTSLTDVTSMVVSHDSGFLDAVCTDIVHYEKDKKLKHYKVRPKLAVSMLQRPLQSSSCCLDAAALQPERPAVRHICQLAGEHHPAQACGMSSA